MKVRSVICTRTCTTNHENLMKISQAHSEIIVLQEKQLKNNSSRIYSPLGKQAGRAKNYQNRCFNVCLSYVNPNVGHLWDSVYRWPIRAQKRAEATYLGHVGPGESAAAAAVHNVIQVSVKLCQFASSASCLSGYLYIPGRYFHQRMLCMIVLSVYRCVVTHATQNFFMWRCLCLFVISEKFRKQIIIFIVNIIVCISSSFSGFFLCTDLTSCRIKIHKSLSACWDKEPLKHATEVQKYTFFHAPMITGYYDPDRLRHAGSQHRPVLSRTDFHFLLHNVITIHQRYRWTDGRHPRSISATC